MNLQKLFEMQTEIENNIANIATIPEDEMGSHNVEELRFLALHIKIAELANLTKCYKYCHIKPNIPQDKLTLRFVDAFQYLLSIGNRAHYCVIRYDALPNNNVNDVIKLFSMLLDPTALTKGYFFRDDFM